MMEAVEVCGEGVGMGVSGEAEELVSVALKEEEVVPWNDEKMKEVGGEDKVLFVKGDDVIDEDIDEIDNCVVTSTGAGDAAGGTEGEESGGSGKKNGRRVLMLKNGDIVAKFDQSYQLVGGKVIVEKEIESPSVEIMRVEWDDNISEKISTTDDGEVVGFSREIGVLDRKAIGIGKEVTDGKRRGWVRNKRCVATLSLNESPDVLIEDVPVELLVRPSPMKKDVKMLYNNDWIGLVVQAKSKIHFKVDKDEKIGWLDDEGFSINDPIPGEKLPKLTISMLWDAHWAQSSDYWIWNFIKYLGDSATVLRTEVYRLHVAWMGRVGKQVMDLNDETPPNEIEGLETVSEVKLLYGRNETYLKQHDVWMYTVREGDKTASYGIWTLKFHDDVFVDPENSTNFAQWKDGGSQDEEMDIEEPYNLVAGSSVPVTVVVFRSVLDIDWEDGTSEVAEMIDIKAVDDYLAKFEPGDIVRDYGISGICLQKRKYGFVEKIERGGMMKVKWVDASTSCAPLVFTTTVSQYDMELVDEWRCLKHLHSCPLVVSEVQLVPSVTRVGVLVGVSVPDAKIIVRFMDGTERLVWAHEYPRFKGDVKFNFHLGIWTSSNDQEDLEFIENDKAILPVPSFEVYSKCSALGKYHFKIQDFEPSFNSFSECEFELRQDDAKFQIHLQKEITLLKETLPSDTEVGLWIETFSTRPDLFTVTLVGPYGSIYEGHLIVLDLMLPFDYPNGPVKVRINSQDLSLVRGLLACGYESGLLKIPASVATYSEKKSTVLSIVSYIRDVVMNEPKISADKLSPDCKEQDEINSMYLRMLEYTDTILRFPHPDILDSDRYEFIRAYYGTMLQKIIQKSESYLFSCEETMASVEDAGNGNICGFTSSLKLRLDKLSTFLPVPTALVGS